MDTLCSNCGDSLATDVNFCPKCGMPTSSYNANSGSSPNPMAEKPNKEMRWTIIGTAIAVISLTIALLTWIHPFSPTPPTSGVQETLTTFCNAGKKGDFSNGYNLLSNGYHHKYSESAWAQEINDAWNSRGGLYSCAVSDASDDGSSGRGTITFVYNDGSVGVAHYMLIMEDGIWKINAACISSCN